MADKSKKLSLLNEELDEESATYIQESIENWKESVMAQLQEEVRREREQQHDHRQTQVEVAA